MQVREAGSSLRSERQFLFEKLSKERQRQQQIPQRGMERFRKAGAKADIPCGSDRQKSNAVSSADRVALS
jgi:hypothetical protein